VQQLANHLKALFYARRVRRTLLNEIDPIEGINPFKRIHLSGRCNALAKEEMAKPVKK